MSALYKIQIREQEQEPFRDYGEWCACAESIANLREIFRDHPEWDLQVVDEYHSVVASTLERIIPQIPSWHSVN